MKKKIEVMPSPEDQALVIVDNMIAGTLSAPTLSNNQAKRAALVCVETIQDNITDDVLDIEYDYWNKVKAEIKKLRP